MTKKINNITIKDVAKKAGVSTATVSHVINKTRYVSSGTEEKVLNAIKELKYAPNIIAKSLRSKKTKTIGLILCDITNPFFLGILQGVESYFGEKGYDLLVTNTDYNPDKELRTSEMFYGKGVDGVIIAPGNDSSNNSIKYLLERNIPIVIVDKEVNNFKVDSVLVNNFEGSRLITKYLIDKGHKRISIISGPVDTYTGKNRLNGYLKALEENYLSVDPMLIKYGDFKEEGGYKSTLEILHMSEPPTAIYACNNLMALGLLRGLKEKRIKIPNDISVVVFDDLPWFAYTNPPLTVVSQPLYKMGETASELLINQINKKRKKKTRIVLETELVIRNSVLDLKEHCGEISRG